MDAGSLLTALHDRFVGYGDPGAALWFVGLEEGGAATWREVLDHLRRWDDHGRPAWAPLRPDPVPDEHPFFGRRPRLQRYWSQCSRIALAAAGEATDREAVRAHQCRQLAAPGSNTALAELLALPAPSTGAWPYGGRTAIAWLQDRATYRDHAVGSRIGLLREQIALQRPRAVVFLGTSARPAWDSVVGAKVPVAPCAPIERDGTGFLVVPHPSSRGVNNARFAAAGRALVDSWEPSRAPHQIRR